jgi:membrane protein involved in colicin uptake
MQRSQSVCAAGKQRGPQCDRCGRQRLQVAEAVVLERLKAKERAGAALERAKLKRREKVAAERAKWRKFMGDKLQAVRDKAAADKARKTALFWAKKAANKAARLAIGGPADGTWVWGVADCHNEKELDKGEVRGRGATRNEQDGYISSRKEEDISRSSAGSWHRTGIRFLLKCWERQRKTDISR